MPSPYEGICLCESVCFRVASEPLMVFSCFCNHCSKGAGGPNQVVRIDTSARHRAELRMLIAGYQIAKFASKDLVVSAGRDSITEFTLANTSSGLPKQKVFCRTCGVTLWTIPGNAEGNHILIRTSILKQAYVCSSCLSYDPKLPVLP